MSSKRKIKGSAAERGIVKRWIAAGIAARRVVLSGALGHLGDEYHGDVKAMVNNQSITIQSKCLANGWAGIYRDIENHDCLIIKANHKESLVILPESLFLSLVGLESGDGSTSERVCATAERHVHNPGLGLEETSSSGAVVGSSSGLRPGKLPF